MPIFSSFHAPFGCILDASFLLRIRLVFSLLGLSDFLVSRIQVKLILVLPCVNQTDGWEQSDIDEYERIRVLADEIIYTSEENKKGCMHKRNRYLVDHSSLCICYMTRKSGGTAYTVEYATSNGLKIINISK